MAIAKQLCCFALMLILILDGTDSASIHFKRIIYKGLGRIGRFLSCSKSIERMMSVERAEQVGHRVETNEQTIEPSESVERVVPNEEKNKDLPPGQNCPICLNEMDIHEELTKTECAHWLHCHCIAPIVHNNMAECPNCRAMTRVEVSQNAQNEANVIWQPDTRADHPYFQREREEAQEYAVALQAQLRESVIATSGNLLSAADEIEALYPERREQIELLRAAAQELQDARSRITVRLDYENRALVVGME